MFPRPPIDVPDLWCHADGAKAMGILRQGRVYPALRALPPVARQRMHTQTLGYRWASQVAWLSTRDVLDPPAEFRFKVLEGQDVYPWSWVRIVWPIDVVDELESAPGADPTTWWLSGGAVRVDLSHRLLPVT